MKTVFLILLCFIFIAHSEEKKDDTLPVGGYISSIHTPTYGNKVTKEILLDFNEMGSGNAVLFKRVPVILDRTITIEETKTCSTKKEKDGKLQDIPCVGLASCGIFLCAIKIKTGLEEENYRQVLLHEYMHCMGFKHNADPEDLMFESENVCSEENIEYYAEQAAERLQIWKNLLNLNSSTKPTK